MEIEFEATFLNIDPEDIRNRLTNAGATMTQPTIMYKRFAFNLPDNIPGGWARVRDEGSKITMSVKYFRGKEITDQKEALVEINSMEAGVIFLESLGCTKKAYQESKREIWHLNDIEISIDEWPYINPFIEIEGTSEKTVKNVSKLLGFSWDNVVFGAVDQIINIQYGVPFDVVNQKTPSITFDGPNPWINWEARV